MQSRQHGHRTVGSVAKEASTVIVDEIELVRVLPQIAKEEFALLALPLIVGIDVLRRGSAGQQASRNT